MKMSVSCKRFHFKLHEWMESSSVVAMRFTSICNLTLYEMIYDAINLLSVPLDLLNIKNELNHSSHALKSVNIYLSKIGQVSRPVYHFCLFVCLFVVVVSRVYLMCFIKSIYCLRCFFLQFAWPQVSLSLWCGFWLYCTSVNFSKCLDQSQLAAIGYLKVFKGNWYRIPKRDSNTSTIEHVVLATNDWKYQIANNNKQQHNATIGWNETKWNEKYLHKDP